MVFSYLFAPNFFAKVFPSLAFGWFSTGGLTVVMLFILSSLTPPCLCVYCVYE